MATPKTVRILNNTSTEIPDPLYGSKVVRVNVHSAVTFTGRGALNAILTGNSSSSFTHNGGFDIRLHPLGVVITDPEFKSKMLVTWGNIICVDLEHGE